MAVTRVYLEQGKSTVFAVCLDWPGWCRQAKTPDLAIAALDDYSERYAEIVKGPFEPHVFKVVGTLKGTGTTDFGAPDVTGPWDDVALTTRELNRQLAILQDCWDYFDLAIQHAPPILKRGPRGGGRDRDAVALHVREAERAYGSRIGRRVAPRTPWLAQRLSILDALTTRPDNAKWPVAYAIRRCAWHIVDHAWEIQDKGVG